MIQAENLTKRFGPQVLFDRIDFKINPRERVGLVGRNGHGKTTLFRIITGLETPDEGGVTIPKNYRIGYVRQELHFTKDTILAEGMKHLPANEKDQAWKVEKILSGLGFSENDFQRGPKEFSGGFQVRLNLAKVLVSDPDLLLLDEPTNYLDITSIRWIMGFLQSWPRELLLITHDRGFMDRVVTHTLAIHRKKVKKIQGDTGKLYEQIAQEEEIYEKTRLNVEKKKKEMELFISRFRAKARLANLVQSRVKAMEKMEKKDKLEKIKNLEFSFRYKEFSAKQVGVTNELAFGYDKKNPLFQNLNLQINANERICIIGPNGKGKSTLLKVLARVLSPDQGEVRYHGNVSLGYFEQTNIKELRDHHTVEEEILYAAPRVERQAARNICGAMLFEGDMALKKVGVLSGGEKSRVMLGKLLVTPHNLLLLDEPTNHLDMESCDALLAALDSFEGTIIMVTHSEMFLHALAERLIVFRKNSVEVFDGNYAEFLEKSGWEEEAQQDSGPIKDSPELEQNAVLEKTSRKNLRQNRARLISERAKAIRPLEKKIENTENQIMALEKKLEEFNALMQEASGTGEGERIKEISKSIHLIQGEMDGLWSDLENLTESLEKKSEEYAIKLKSIETAS